MLSAGLMVPAHALAHAFDERHELPVPLWYFVIGVAATVAVSFLIVALFAWWSNQDQRAESAPLTVTIAVGPLLPFARGLCRLLAVLILFATIAAALAGTANPTMNLAPTLVWVIWWVGGSLFVAGVGNIWPACDPWLAMIEFVDARVRRCFPTFRAGRGVVFNCRWPAALGAWPSVALLMVWSGFEVIFPLAAVPTRIGIAAIAWTVITIAGMVCFGIETWRKNADVFAIYFDTLGRFAPLAVIPNRRQLLLRIPGSGLIGANAQSLAMAAFIVAMLAGVLFDGLLAGEAWRGIEQSLRLQAPKLMDANAYLTGSLGLLLVWLLLFALFMFASAVTGVIRGKPEGVIGNALAFSPSLVPIAIAYMVAHNLPTLIVRGQNLVPLLSDPLGAGWNIFATAGYRPNSSIIGMGAAWHIAIIAIVAGHVISVWLAHRAALRICETPREAVLACIPLTFVMVVFTGMSLLVLAEPMVRFDPAPGAIALPVR